MRTRRESFLEIEVDGFWTNIRMSYIRCFRFLKENGFYTYRTADGGIGFVRVENDVAHIVSANYIRGFVLAEVKKICGNEMTDAYIRFVANSEQKLSYGKLWLLERTNILPEREEKGGQA